MIALNVKKVRAFLLHSFLAALNTFQGILPDCIFSYFFFNLLEIEIMETHIMQMFVSTKACYKGWAGWWIIIETLEGKSKRAPIFGWTITNCNYKIVKNCLVTFFIIPFIIKSINEMFV